MSRRALLVVAAVAVLALSWWVAQRPGPTLYVGGPVLTMDAESRVAQALAVDGDRIAWVGDEAGGRAWADEHGARIVDLAGGALLPGFIDAHGHFPGAGIYALLEDLNSPPIGTVESIDDVVERLAGRAADTRAGDWVAGMSYDDTLLAERRHPTRHDLDRVSTRHPVAVLHVSGHLAAVNTLALTQLGFDADSPDPEGGVIRREAGSRRPDGVLEETAMDGLTFLLEPSVWEGFRVLRHATERYLAAGVTTAQSGYSNRVLIGSLATAARFRLTPIRLVIWPDPPAADALLDGSFDPDLSDPLRARLGAVKIVADGSIQGYTGYLSEPYHVPPRDDPDYRGYPRVPREDLIRMVERYHAAGLQVAVHGNGDASIDDVLDAFESALAKHPRADTRPIVIHAQMARDDQLDRMAAISAIPSFFSLHTFYWGDRHRQIFMGPARAARMSPARSALERGVRFTIHCDAPVVPMEPLRLVWSAVNRRTRSGVVVGAAQRIGVVDALRAVTIDAAFQHFEEADKGSLEPGKLADLVILSGSPLGDPARIDRLAVRETIIGGRSVWRADAASP